MPPELELPIAYRFTRLAAPRDHIVRARTMLLRVPVGSYFRGVEVGLAPDIEGTDHVDLLLRVQWSEPA